MSNKCYIIKLRNTVNDSSLDILEEDGVIRYNAIAIAEGLSTDKLLHFGASGPFEADITGASSNVTIKSIIGDTNVQSFSGNTYKVTGNTNNPLSGIVFNEQVDDVTVAIKEGLENLKYISFTDIALEDIPDGVEYILFGRSVGSVHPSINLAGLNLANKASLVSINLNSTLSSGNISEFLKLPNKERLAKLILINNPNIVGDIGSLGVLTGLNEFSFPTTGVTGNLEDFVRGQVAAGREAGDIFVSSMKNVNVLINGQNVGDIPNASSKRMSWTTTGDDITIIVYPASDQSNHLVEITISKTVGG